MAFSVKRSNIACVVCLLPRPAARVLRCTAACRVAGRTGLLTASTAFARLKPLKDCSLTAARCLPAMHFGVSGAVRWTDARMVGTPMHWVPRVSCMVLLLRCQSLFGLLKDLGESLYNTNSAMSRKKHSADSNAFDVVQAVVGFGQAVTTGCPGAEEVTQILATGHQHVDFLAAAARMTSTQNHRNACKSRFITLTKAKLTCCWTSAALTQWTATNCNQ
jgi:hypothetical protein